ncbi:MAG: UDP-N-acetylmuramate--L-alanine ligase [Vampirovibrionales bacterium]|nr:UDP-N-acetylmuramate--L-alanine ligase [Vampirovibrionales bacterium]
MTAPPAPSGSLDISASAPAARLTLSPERPTHFVGIGGIGMSGLAKLLLEAGLPVSGSDVAENANTRLLSDSGAHIAIGHASANVPANATVIASTAIRRDNPEVAIALERGQAIFHRSDLLREILHGEAMGSAQTIGVAGAHGKTSATGMIAVSLLAAGQQPTVIVGGKLPGWQTNALAGTHRRIAVAELDESDGSLTRYQPTHAVLLNIELDHADHFTGGLPQVAALFGDFVAALPPGAFLYFNAACAQTVAVVSQYLQGHDKRPVALFPDASTPETSDLSVFFQRFPQTLRYAIQTPSTDTHGCYGGIVLKNGDPLATLQMAIPGAHQLFNAMAALAISDQLGLSLTPITQALNAFSGMGRRFERLAETPFGVLVDDYAHHPTETLAMTRAGRDWLARSAGRLIVIFQPHRYTRLKTFWDEFLQAFDGADVLYVCDVYAASEDPIAGIDSRAFCAALRQAGIQAEIRYWPGRDWNALRVQLQAEGSRDDLIMTMGAGDITHALRGWPWT